MQRILQRAIVFTSWLVKYSPGPGVITCRTCARGVLLSLVMGARVAIVIDGGLFLIASRDFAVSYEPGPGVERREPSAARERAG